MSRTPDHRLRALVHVALKVGGMSKGDAAIKFQAELRRLQSGAEALDNVNANRSPLETEAAHIAKVAGIARKYDREVVATVNRMGELYQESRQDLQRRIDSKVNLTPNAFAPEIRETVRRMNKHDRMELLHTLVKENRATELAAIIKAPALATGISEDERSRYEALIVSMHAPGELAEQAELEAVFEESFAATKFAGDYATSLTSPGKVAAIEQGHAAATEAVDAFEQSLQ